MHSANDRHSNALARYSSAATLIFGSRMTKGRHGFPVTKIGCLMIKTMQQVGNPRGNRLVQVSVHFPEFVTDTNPHRSGKSPLRIISGNSPFRKSILLPHRRLLHGTKPLRFGVA